jgi:zinc transporter ZupT
MIFIYNAVLFLITLSGGSAPLWSRGWTENRIKYLLAFSGAFLLSITFLHLVPESMGDLGPSAGILLIVGFFGQQLIQKYTHGVEHGHLHTGQHAGHSVPVVPVLIGLSIHAFSEGIPLGIPYTDPAVLPSLFLAIALHKMPEAMLIISLCYHKNKSKSRSLAILVLFSLITPASSLLAYLSGQEFSVAAELIHWCIPLIAGAFIHISTTIFFESGTKAHEMNFKKWLAVGCGIGLGLLSLLGGFIH